MGRKGGWYGESARHSAARKKGSAGGGPLSPAAKQARAEASNVKPTRESMYGEAIKQKEPGQAARDELSSMLKSISEANRKNAAQAKKGVKRRTNWPG